jgi:hypothetical protein
MLVVNYVTEKTEQNHDDDDDDDGAFYLGCLVNLYKYNGWMIGNGKCAYSDEKV